MASMDEGRFAADRLYYRSWRPETPPRAQVVLSHGFAEHSGRYHHVAEALVDTGLSVWAPDHRGHGQSEGTRADIESVWEAADDLNRFVDVVRDRAPEGPLFLVGHSMGGLIATAFTERHQDRLAGLVLSGALLHIAPEVAALADLEEVPDLGLADAISSDPAVVQAYKDDPLVYLGPPPRVLLRASGQIEEVRAGLADLSLPLLVMHGSADLLVSPQALKDVVMGVASPDLTARLWPGLWHEIFNEPQRARVLGVLCEWIAERIP
jgi:alpha-beta hydrolase superfamily lysophospholipase